jgi:hypothetical protein
VASNETVGLIAAGAVIGGALLGGCAQAFVSWREHVHERKERKANAYRDALRHLYALPGTFVEALALDPDEQETRLHEYYHQQDLVQSELSLVAPPAIRKIMSQDLREAMEAWQEASKTKRSGDVRLRLRKDFFDNVEPTLQRLADAMARDTDVR